MGSEGGYWGERRRGSASMQTETDSADLDDTIVLIPGEALRK